VAPLDCLTLAGHPIYCCAIQGSSSTNCRNPRSAGAADSSTAASAGNCEENAEDEEEHRAGKRHKPDGDTTSGSSSRTRDEVGDNGSSDTNARNTVELAFGGGSGDPGFVGTPVYLLSRAV
jgi:hypothetical protein